MTSDSFIEVVHDAVDRTGMTEVPVANRTSLLSDNGSGYVSRAFRDYLQMVGIRHILATPFHPQTNGKLERYHQTIKGDVNQVPYEAPSDLQEAIAAFVSYYNHRLVPHVPGQCHTRAADHHLGHNEGGHNGSCWPTLRKRTQPSSAQ